MLIFDFFSEKVDMRKSISILLFVTLAVSAGMCQAQTTPGGGGGMSQIQPTTDDAGGMSHPRPASCR